jgi:hypothetical protein
MRPRYTGLVLLLGIAFTACRSSPYLRRNDGAPTHEIRIVNNCRPETALVYVDDEFDSRGVTDVKARRVDPGKPVVVKLSEGWHNFVAEFRDGNRTNTVKDRFRVTTAESLQLCAN